MADATPAEKPAENVAAKNHPTWWINYLDNDDQWQCQDVKAESSTDALAEFKELWAGDWKQTGVISRIKPIV